MGLKTKPLCLFCESYKGLIRCEAYPKGIPSDILLEDVLHDRIYKDQEGETVFSFNEKSRHADLSELNDLIEWPNEATRQSNSSEDNTKPS